jgi:hypothetical protein
MLLYAVVPADARLGSVCGVGGRSVEAVRADSAAVVAELMDGPVSSDADSALRFAEAVGAIAETATVLPVRFPTTAPSRDAVLDLLERNSDEWSRRLGELAGRVELSVRMPSAPPSSAATTPDPDAAGEGAAYLAERARLARNRESALQEVEGLLAARSTASRRLPDRDGQVRLACLVDRDAAARLRQALEEWRSADGRRLQVAGPWPPYSFATEEEAR